ncbi:hypothetical protein D1BOALGB6SA_1876 [Olavius sp. associated proteobacterium Delta 1]|nr:hypothetical protein D1BOALGB6SA_1876 [Olavius sp. associated proteobacterium Delta 1]
MKKISDAATARRINEVKALLELPGFRWNSRQHGQAMILSPDDLFSPVSALLEKGIADEHPAESIPLPWTVHRCLR